jgi:ribosome recycling factor
MASTEALRMVRHAFAYVGFRPSRAEGSTGVSMAAKKDSAGKSEKNEFEGLSLDEVVDDAALRMMGAVESLGERLKRIRTGRASPALVEHIRVQCYGSESPLRQVAGIAVPEPRLIMLRPYDVSILADIEKAIVAADLGLNPQNDGKVIRIPIPPLTEERRRELAKLVDREAEAAKVAIRNVRRDANRAVDEIRKAGASPEDACFAARERIQKHTDENEKEVDAAAEAKTAEIMEV